MVLLSPSEFSPSYGKPWYLCWRAVIVAGRRRKSSASFGAPAIVHFPNLPPAELEEVQAARPLRTKVITVQPGDTVEPLSHRMAGVDRPMGQYARVATHDHRFQRGTTLEQQRG